MIFILHNILNIIFDTIVFFNIQFHTISIPIILIIIKIQKKMSIFNFFKKTDQQVQQQSQAKTQSPSTFYNPTKPTLPQNFAQTVMDLEMQMEFVQSCDIDVVTQLNQLYRMAIQYYATVDNKKAQHFHRKLTALLTNPNTIDVIQQKKISAKTVHLEPGIYTQNLKQQLNKFNSQSQLVVRSMIEGNDKKMQQNSRLISQNIQSQQSQLMRRLQERSRSKNKGNKQ